MKIHINRYVVEGTPEEVGHFLRVQEADHEPVKRMPSFTERVSEQLTWDNWGVILKEINAKSQEFATEKGKTLKRGERKRIKADMQGWTSLPIPKMKNYLLTVAKKYGRTVNGVIGAYYNK